MCKDSSIWVIAADIPVVCACRRIAFNCIFKEYTFTLYCEFVHQAMVKNKPTIQQHTSLYSSDMLIWSGSTISNSFLGTRSMPRCLVKEGLGVNNKEHKKKAVVKKDIREFRVKQYHIRTASESASNVELYAYNLMFFFTWS